MSSGHSHAVPENKNENTLWIALGLTTCFLVAEVVAGLLLNSCPVPCDHIPVRSWPLFKARQLMRDVIESLQGEKKS